MTPLRSDFGAERPRVPLRVAHRRCERSGTLAMVTPCSDENTSRFVSTVTISRYVAIDAESEREMLPHILAVDG